MCASRATGSHYRLRDPSKRAPNATCTKISHLLQGEDARARDETIADVHMRVMSALTLAINHVIAREQAQQNTIGATMESEFIYFPP